MIEITEWIGQFTEKILKIFNGSVEFIGIQGSCGRGEAGKNSDIDVVVIFDNLDIETLQKYKALISEMEKSDKICGFAAGKDELKNWDRADLMRLYYDTSPLYGALDYIIKPTDKSYIKQAVLNDACNIYHACVHNFLHAGSAEVIKTLYKSVFFVLREKYFYETGRFVKQKNRLFELLANEKIVKICKKADETDFLDDNMIMQLSSELIEWTGDVIRKFGYEPSVISSEAADFKK